MGRAAPRRRVRCCVFVVDGCRLVTWMREKIYSKLPALNNRKDGQEDRKTVCYTCWYLRGADCLSSGARIVIWVEHTLATEAPWGMVFCCDTNVICRLNKEIFRGQYCLIYTNMFLFIFQTVVFPLAACCSDHASSHGPTPFHPFDRIYVKIFPDHTDESISPYL